MRPTSACLGLLAIVAATAPAAVFAGDGAVGMDAPTAGETTVVAKKRSPYLKVTSVRPQHGKIRVPRDAEILITFSEAIDPTTISAVTVDLHLLFGARISWRSRLEQGGKRLVISPDAPLKASADYELLVNPGIKSVSGKSLKAFRRTIFSTLSNGVAAVLRGDQFEDLESRMIEPRAAHTAVLLSNGEVFLAGGQINATDFASTAETFSPTSHQFRSVNTLLPGPRAFHPAAAAGTTVYMPGGWDGSDALRSTDYYDGNLRTVTVGPALVEQRDFHAAVALPDGRVFVTGGLSYTPGGAVYSSTAEILDGGSFRATVGKPIRRRAGLALTVLIDGRVLITGGQSSQSGIAPTAEIFDPSTETFLETLPGQNFRQLHAATRLRDGTVLLSDGGAPTLEVFDPETEHFGVAGGSTFNARDRSTASLLPDGKVLFVGGQVSGAGIGSILSTMDLWDPTSGTGRVFRVTVQLSSPRVQHTATALYSDQILIAGGLDPAGGTNFDTATLFTPDPAPATSKRR